MFGNLYVVPFASMHICRYLRGKDWPILFYIIACLVSGHFRPFGGFSPRISHNKGECASENNGVHLFNHAGQPGSRSSLENQGSVESRAGDWQDGTMEGQWGRDSGMPRGASLKGCR